jgi:DNA-binding transcriptional ArsR family regulator
LTVSNHSEGLDQMPPRPVSIDHRLAKALSNPLRAKVLHLVAAGVDSPKAVGEALGKDVRGIAYHVRVLHELGCIELTDTHERRGAVEHVYRVTERGLGKT